MDTQGGSGIPAAAGSASVGVSTANNLIADPTPVRHVFGSLEAQLRASGTSAANMSDAPPVAAPAAVSGRAAPVSFNNRTALLSTANVTVADTTTKVH